MARSLLLLALLSACDTPTPSPSSSSGGSAASGDEDATQVVARNRGILVTAPDYIGRAKAAWALAPSVTITDEGGKFVQKVGTPVLVDVASKLTGFVKDQKVTEFSSNPALIELLGGTDEKSVAEALRKQGYNTLVVHYALAPSFDRDSHLLSHLYHHDSLTYFQLARVENGAFVYLIVDQPLGFPPDLASGAVNWLRDTLSGKNPAPFPPVKAPRSDWRLITTLRGQGQELSFSLAEAQTLDRALVETADDLETMYRRQKEILGFPRLDRNMANLVIEMRRVSEAAVVVPRDDESLASFWEMGLDGAILLDRPTDEERKAGKKGQSAVWPGDVANARGITKVDSFLKAAAREFRWDSTRPWRDSSVDLELVRTQHWIEEPGMGVVSMYRGTAPVPMDAVTLTSVRESILLAGEWYLRNLQPDGQVTYKFWPEDNRYSDEYNHVRHTLATWNLWQAYTLDPRPEFLAGAIRAQKWTLQSLQERDSGNLSGWELELVKKSPLADDIQKNGMAYFTQGGNTKLGSVVVGLLGMIEVAKATNDHSNDELMRKLGRFVLFMQESSGTFRGYHVPPDHPYHDEENDIVPGEAALSLVYLSEYFNDPSYVATLPKFFEYYKPWFHERAKKAVPGAVWPAQIYPNDTRLELVQFGPWTVMAANAYTRVKPDAQDVADFGLEVARWMIDTYEYTGDRTPYPDYIGGYYKYEGELPAMQAFCYGEGTAAAYGMALRMKPAEAAYFELHTRETVRFAFQMQHDGLDTRPYSRPDLILGGIKYAMNEPKVRIDYVHHALSAMYQWLEAAKTDPNLPAGVKAEPDEGTKRILALQGMPGFRSKDIPNPQPVPEAVPGATTAAPAAAPAKEEKDGE